MKGFDEYYDEAVEPGKRERAFAWATAIGLQDVDGLKPSKYLFKTAKRHIEGKITQEEARRLVDHYYETKASHDESEDAKIADKVATRMIAVINSPTFRFSPEYLIGLHARIFDGVYPHAGKIRKTELTKKEWVLRGDTLEYAPSFDILRSLEYDFEKEKKFSYKGLSDDAFIAHFAAFISGIWQIHPFREGNTRTTGLFAIKYLRSKGYTVTNDLFVEKSWYFRNALVRANYEKQEKGIEKTTLPLEEFFKVLLFDEQIELRNRFLRVGFEYGSQAGDAVAELHRKGNQKAALKTRLKTGLKTGLKKGSTGARILSAFENDSNLTIGELVKMLGLARSSVTEQVAKLKSAGHLRRIGPDKGGHWEVVR